MGKPSAAKKSLSISLELKPPEPGGGLRPSETQLLIAYIGEILAEIEIEEQKILEENILDKNKT